MAILLCGAIVALTVACGGSDAVLDVSRSTDAGTAAAGGAADGNSATEDTAADENSATEDTAADENSATEDTAADEAQPDGGTTPGAGGERPSVDLGPGSGLDGLPAAATTSPPGDWWLGAAAAEVHVGGAVTRFGGDYADCAVLPTTNGLYFGSNFQENEDRYAGPSFSYTDGGDGTIVWGLALGPGDEEWSGKPNGTPLLQWSQGEFAFLNLGAITFDPEANGLDPFGRAFVMRAQWSGEASENFSTEQKPATVDVVCVWFPPELRDRLTDSNQ